MMFRNFILQSLLFLTSFIIATHSMAMEVPNKVKSDKLELVAKEISEVFQAKDAFVRGVTAEMLKIKDPNDFKEFLADLADIKIDGLMEVTNFQLFKKSNIERLITIINQQEDLKNCILSKIEEFSRTKNAIAKLNCLQAEDCYGMEQRYLIELYLFIYEGQQISLANRKDNVQKTFNEALKGKKQNLANMRKKQSQQANNNNIYISFDEELRPFGLYQSSMDIILENLGQDLADFLVKQTSFGPTSKSKEAVVRLSYVKFSQEDLNKSIQTFNHALEKLVNIKKLLNPDANFDQDINQIKWEKRSLDFQAKIQKYRLHEMLNLQKIDESADFEIIHAADERNFLKMGLFIKDFEKKNLYLNIEEATRELMCELNSLEKALKAKMKAQARAIKKAEEKHQGDSSTDSPTSEDEKVINNQEISEEPIAEKEEYELDPWKKYISKKKITLANNNGENPLMSEFDKIMLMVNEFNKTQRAVYMALLDDKPHHKEFSALDLVSVVAGFNGVPFSGHNGSHFTFQIPHFGSVYIVKPHGKKDCLKLTGSTFNIFRNRLKSLRLLSPELQKHFL